MKTIYVDGWRKLRIDNGTSSVHNFVGKEIIREGGILKHKVTSVSASCPVDILDSVYLKSDSVNVDFGEAFSATDRAIELALVSLKCEESAHVEIILEGKFVHESCLQENVKVSCVLSYSIVRNGKQVYDYGPDEKLNMAKKYKEAAVRRLAEFKDMPYQYPYQINAFILMARGIKWLSAIAPDDLPPDEEGLNLLKIQCYNNFSHFHLSLGNNEKAISAADTVLSLNPGNIKALYRRAVANTNLCDYSLAEDDLRQILNREPLNGAAKKQLQKVFQMKKSLNQQYAQAMKKFLS